MPATVNNTICLKLIKWIEIRRLNCVICTTLADHIKVFQLTNYKIASSFSFDEIWRLRVAWVTSKILKFPLVEALPVILRHQCHHSIIHIMISLRSGFFPFNQNNLADCWNWVVDDISTCKNRWRRRWITDSVRHLPFDLTLIEVALNWIETYDFNWCTLNPKKKHLCDLPFNGRSPSRAGIGMLRQTNWKLVEFHKVFPRNWYVQFYDFYFLVFSLERKKKLSTLEFLHACNPGSDISKQKRQRLRIDAFNRDT